MPQMVFINLPVEDLPRSVEFFTGLGFTFNPQFTDESATCMVVSDTIFVMLLVRDRFAQFIDKPLADARQTTEVLVALSCDSADEVRAQCERAFALGARRYKDPVDYGFMLQWGFEDLDGHVWELVWMDPSHVQPT